MIRRHPPARSSATRRQRGLSLVELMIASTIGLFIVVTISSLVVSAAAGSRSSEANAAMQASARQAMDTLRVEFLHAGFPGLTRGEPGVSGAVSVGGDCAAGFSTNLRMRVWGANDANPFAATCIPAATYSAGDVVAIRRVSLASVATPESDRVNVRSAYDRAVVFQGASAPSGVDAPFADYNMAAAVYFISPYTRTASESPRIPALYRVRLGAGPNMSAPELVASGIENMQIEYGIRDANGATIYVSANNVSASANSATTGVTEWDNLTSVRISLLVRSESIEIGYAPGARSVQVGDRSIAVNDSYRRQVVSSVIQLRNS